MSAYRTLKGMEAMHALRKGQGRSFAYGRSNPDAVIVVRDEGWQRVLDLNLTSAFRFSQRIGRCMVAQRRGAIINIAAPANKGWPAIAAYAAAKAELVSRTQTLAAEWAAAGVRVNALAPGWVKTAINQAYLADQHLADITIFAVPLQRWGEPEEMVGTAVWLASDAARYVTGAVISVDGGFAVGLPKQWLEAMNRSAPYRQRSDRRPFASNDTFSTRASPAPPEAAASGHRRGGPATKPA